jgi:hypothetical protein
VAYAEAHLLPFFRHHRLGESTAEQVGAYRTHKLREAQIPPSRECFGDAARARKSAGAHPTTDVSLGLGRSCHAEA